MFYQLKFINSLVFCYLFLFCGQGYFNGYSCTFKILSDGGLGQTFYRTLKENLEEFLFQRRDRADQLYEIGRIYELQDNYALALQYYQQALLIYKEIVDRHGEARSLYSLASTYERQGNYQQAVDSYQQALFIFRSIDSKEGEWRVLSNLGAISVEFGRYSEALNYHQQALGIIETLDQPQYQQAALNSLGGIYRHLGQYQKALEVYQQALELNREEAISSEENALYQRRSEGVILHNIGFTYQLLEDYSQAVEFYQRALLIYREIGSREGEAEILGDTGFAYFRMEKLDLAVSLLEQSLTLSQEINNYDGIVYALNSLGEVYVGLNQLDKSWDAYRQALIISSRIRDRPQQLLILSNIGDLLVQQNQPELAILFYKRSVNVTEAIRQDIEGLPIEYQQSYTNTVADTYRKLADLLLQQDRVLEAQQVLDLLKVQELDDYLHQVRGNEETAQGIDLLPQERSVIEQFDQQLEQAIEFGRELTELEAIPRDDRTLEQEQRLLELREKERQTRLAYNEFLATPDVQTLIQQLRQTTAGQNIEPLDLISLRRNLGELQQDVVLLYPLILEDRLELVLSTPYAPPIHRAVPVGRVELNQAIAEFRSALGAPNSDPQPLAQKLYDWLIRPIEADLEQANAQTIFYAPDGQLRYIPLAALHDGNQWAIERFRINNITALSLTNLSTVPDAEPDVLAAAFTTGRYNFERGGRRYGFSGLPFSEIEVERLANLYSDTTQLIDDAFNRNTTLNAINDYNIVHLATHAAFVTGQPDDSFILLGDGELITLRDIDELSLTNVDLMVLSGCQTGLGALGNGEEILGFGYQIQEAGARAAIASLWSVDDGGTQVLMNQFYAVLNQGNVTKTAALQQAQIALINADATLELGTFSHSDVQALRHPYYWAGFILIGNGL